MELNRRQLLTAAAALVVDQWAAARGIESAAPVGRKMIVVTCGGIRREDTFADSGIENIPHLYKDLLPQSVLFENLRNEGVTSHYNTISSILTGNWQRLDDWGKTSPASVTIFEQLRRQMRVKRDQVWLISSNKALTAKIASSSVAEFGPEYGANVVFPKQLLIKAVVQAAQKGEAVHSTDRATVAPEIEAILNGDNYDGLGWNVGGDPSTLDKIALGTIQDAITDLVKTNAPVTGDEFTYLVTVEVMKRFAPAMMVVTFSDMEVAHFGSYSLHLGGISTVDRLVYELWNTVQGMPGYKDQTTMMVMPEFGRDLDGSTTNGFFNHRQGSESTRGTWMMCLGDAIKKPGLIEEPVLQTQIHPTIGKLFGIKTDVSGKPLPGLWL